MAYKEMFAALSLAFAASPLAAHQETPPTAGAPMASADARYCLRVEVTGSIIEPVQCWTREEWAEQDVDVDKEWAENGVRVIT